MICDFFINRSRRNISMAKNYENENKAGNYSTDKTSNKNAMNAGKNSSKNKTSNSSKNSYGNSYGNKTSSAYDEEERY